MVNKVEAARLLRGKMSKSDVNMICDVAELSSLFEKSRGLDDFLQATVGAVAGHMNAAVCSIYIYDEKSRMLTLRATQGLESEAIGTVQLGLGQGITGFALKELRPIREGRASKSTKFKAFKDIGEEKYEAFLAVPIRHGLTRVGVLTVQDAQPDYFDEKDEQALRAIAGQLATVIESAHLLLAVHRQEEVVATAKPVSSLLKGRPASGGIARGKLLALDFGKGRGFSAPEKVPPGLGLADFDRALEVSSRQLKALQREADEELSDVALLIFSAHQLILADEEFFGEIRVRIGRGASPVDAVVAVVCEYIEIFEKSSSPRLREKVHDLRDLSRRLLENLVGAGRESGDYTGKIILAEELLPSDVLKLATEKAEGFIVQGGVTSHIAIICRSLQKPMVMIDPQQVMPAETGVDLLIDGNQGTLYIEPSDAVVAEYESHLRSLAELEAAGPIATETQTNDGTRVALLANVNLLNDLKLAGQFGAEGIGLYRSEFPFLVRNEFPSEEEQYVIYRKIAEAMGDREVTFRTLDIGGDKMLSYSEDDEEANPFLGMRAIRFSLANKEIFGDQLCALLRASEGCANARIMFPFIASLDDFLEARDVVEQCKSELRMREVAFNENVQLGVMVELPSAVELVEELAREVAFMSLGTNDLIQYMLAVDRTNQRVAEFYCAHHPAILRAIKKVADAAQRNGVDLSLCGDMAVDKTMLPFLFGVGIRKLSVPPREMPKLQRMIGMIDTKDATDTAEKMLEAGSISGVADVLKSKAF